MASGETDEQHTDLRAPARRTGGRSAAVLNAVRSATMQLLDEVGYDELQLPEVAARAGVNKTTVYRRWPSKAELIGDMLQRLATNEVPIPDTGSLYRDLVTLLDNIVELTRGLAVREVLRAAITHVDTDPALRATQRRFWDERFQRASVIVERAVTRGELPSDTDPRRFLEQACSPIYFRLLVTGDPIEPADIANFAAHTTGRTDARANETRG